MYRGHEFARLHGDPYRWPHGYGYRRWEVGYRLPPVFLLPEYYVDYGPYGLEAPPPGFQWVRYGPDLLLVSLATGEVLQTVYDAYE
jgi:Ni/Co efflux regulator RcnB